MNATEIVVYECTFNHLDNACLLAMPVQWIARNLLAASVIDPQMTN
jgi:hypothetical protein